MTKGQRRIRRKTTLQNEVAPATRAARSPFKRLARVLGKDYPIGLDLARWRVRAVRNVKRVLGLDRTIYVDQRRAEYRGYWQDAARILGADFEVLSDRLWQISLGGRTTRISEYVAQFDDPVTLRIAGDKLFCLGLAQHRGVPVPEHFPFTLSNLAEAQAFLGARGGYWVVKPLRGTGSGLGISTHVRSDQDLKKAAILASLYCPDILLERCVVGESYRLLFLAGDMIHAVRRRGVRVTGDGVSTVADLLERVAGTNLQDPVVEATLSGQGVSPLLVPAHGESVLVRGLPASETRLREVRTVYDEDVTDLIAPDIVSQLRGIVDEVRTRFVGVDIITTDPTKPLIDSGGAFIELNTTPGLHHHYQRPSDEVEHPVTVQVLRHLLSERRAPQAATASSIATTDASRRADGTNHDLAQLHSESPPTK